MANSTSPPPSATSPPPPPPIAPDAEGSAKVDGNAQDVKGEAANEPSEKPFFAASEPMREDQVQNAVKFLSHPRVRGSPVIYRRSFLEKKGLTKEEIDEAFRRVPDPPSNAATVEAATANQATQPKSTTSLQPQAPTQAPQPAAASVNSVAMVPNVQQSRFHWSHALIAAGVLAASGAGTAVFFKNVVVPRLKTWIRKVVAEENETQKENKSSSILADQTAAAAKAAASAAAVVAKASEELLSSKNEERKFFEAFMGMMDVQVKEMKSMGDTIRKLESTRGNSYSQEKLIEEHARYATGNGTTNNSWGTSQVNQPDATFSSMAPKLVKLNGTHNADSGTVRPSSAPATVEPMAAPHPKSYMEILSMVQRGETPPNIKEINDMPPNPNQQPTKPLLAPRPKPWEVAQQRPSYSLLSQSSGEGLSSEVEVNGPSSHANGKLEDASEEWWRKKSVKITEIEPEAVEEPRQFPTYSSGASERPIPTYSSGASERPIQRGWVPPQPPTVAIPEAAAAIRQPKPLAQKQQQQPLVDEHSMPRSDDGEVGSVRPDDVSGVELEGSGSLAAVELKQTEIEEEPASGVMVN